MNMKYVVLSLFFIGMNVFGVTQETGIGHYYAEKMIAHQKYAKNQHYKNLRYQKNKEKKQSKPTMPASPINKRKSFEPGN
jgi:hypothetical protein